MSWIVRKSIVILLGLNLSGMKNRWDMLEGCAFSASPRKDHDTLDLVITREDKNTIQN